MKSLSFCSFGLCVVLVAVMQQESAATAEALSRRESLRDMYVPRRRPVPNTCDLPSLPNGKVLRRQRGKMLQYVCNTSFKLIGSKYTTCKNRHWDSPVPICTKPGCPDISTQELQDHMIFYEDSKRMVTLRCRSEYVLKGASIAYCDGVSWDRALGTCHDAAGLDNLSCDFESDDLCGWSHDENEDFRWARRSGQSSNLRHRTGPRADHTVGKLHEGHYMLLESYEHEEGDRALFFSPIYSAEKSNDACFRFFYHMYGMLVGSLKVYIKPVSVDLDTIYIDPKYRFFEMKGNQKNVWREARFVLEEVPESFQIIFEGVLRSSLYGDIAIDDVELLHGEECLPDAAGGTTEAAEELEDNFAVSLSCDGRCGEQSRSNKTGGCDCHNECSDSYSCCADFGKVCLSSDTPPTTTARATTKQRAATTTGTMPPVTKKVPPTPVSGETTRTTRTTVSTTTTRTTPTTGTTKTTVSGTASRAATSNESSEFVEPITSIKIQPKALDNELPPGMEVVSVHKTVIFVSVVGCLCLALVVTMLLMRHFQQRRRLLDPEFYKRRSHNPNGGTLSAREEFSDIRYLTEEEQLDFSLASPSSFRPAAPAPAGPPKVDAGRTDDEKSGSKSSTPKNGKRGKSQKKASRDNLDEGLLGNEDEDYEDEEW